MSNKRQNLKPDTVVKNYWNNNEQFADFFNAVLFNGEQVIKPEELEDVDTEESSVMEHRKYAESIQASRDNIKVMKTSAGQGVEFVMLGNEGQEHIHYAMPVRVMGYDYGTYKKQYDDNAGKYKISKGIEEDEYLSKMKKTDKFIPVITVVVYYGEKPWDGATSLHGMLNIDSRLKQYVNDYKLLLVEARKNNLKLHNINNIDLFNLLEILLDKSKPVNETKNKAIKYAKEHKVEKSVIMTAAGAANCVIDYNDINKEADVDMCTVFEKTREEGMAEGIIVTGLEYGASEEDILSKLQSKLNVSLQKAQEYLDRFMESSI